MTVILSLVSLAQADEYSAPSFRVLDPVLAPGGFSSSTDFQLFGSIGELAIGSSSISSFGLRSAFLYFPVVATPVVSATAGDGAVSLSWSTVTASTGWTVGGYNVGQATAPDGPYSYTSLGNVTSATRSGLSNGTTYYFVIRVEDALGYTIATSSEVSAVPVSSSGGGSPDGGGKSGGGAVSPSVTFSGLAYPHQPVVVLEDGQRVGDTVADAIGNFVFNLSGVGSGVYLFAVYGEDSYGQQSKVLTFPVTVVSREVTRVSGIFITPTLMTDKQAVKPSDVLELFGQGPPGTTIEFLMDGPKKQSLVSVESSADGHYRYSLQTGSLIMGEYRIKSRAVLANGLASQFGRVVIFTVGSQTIIREPLERCPKPADLNGDCRVNLIDFSILIYWLERPRPPAEVDLDHNQKIDLADFSVAAYYWTG